MHIVETDRLYLRCFSTDDLDDIYRLVYADARVKDTWSGATGTPEELKERFANNWIRTDSPFGFRAVVLKEPKTLIGLMGFQPHEPGEGDEIYYLHSEDVPNRRVGFDPEFIEAELTYALGYEYWKQGYATEMGKAIIRYGFDELALGRIIQGVHTSNPNSVNLMRRLGFRIEKGTAPNQTVGILEKQPTV